MGAWKNKKPMEVCSPSAIAKFVYPMCFAGFHRAETHSMLLETPYHFRGFGSAKCLIAGKPSRVLDAVGCDFGTPTLRLYLFSEDSAAPVAAFSRFYVLWHHELRLDGWEQAKSKGWSRRPRSFPCPSAPKELYHERKFFSTEDRNTTSTSNPNLHISQRKENVFWKKRILY